MSNKDNDGEWQHQLQKHIILLADSMSCRNPQSHWLISSEPRQSTRFANREMVKGSLTDRGLPHSVFSWGPEVKSSPLFCKWRKLRTKKGEGNGQRHHDKRHYPGFKPNPPLSVLVTNTLLCFSSLLLSHLVDRSHVLHWGVSLRTQCSSLDFHWWIGFYWTSDHPCSSFQHLIGLRVTC